MPFKPKTVDRDVKSAKYRALHAQVMREETECGICLKFVDKSLNGRKNPMGPTLGHILSVKARPDLEFDRNNVQLEHRICNIRSGA